MHLERCSNKFIHDTQPFGQVRTRQQYQQIKTFKEINRNKENKSKINKQQ